MKCEKYDWVRLNNFPDQGPFLIELVTDTCYHIDFGDGLEVTYDIEVSLDLAKMRDIKLERLLNKKKYGMD